ncbi:hypothetical protein [Cutibacterium namnetense]|uniref:hypothetical protein n=1 Tax=Cutibacterium namnetense TaxID=1574624 RepID=UPI00254EEA37|nr:hypothetical protein [Cutibacterium namnetense]
MRIAVPNTRPCQPSLGGKRIGGLTAAASPRGQLAERAVIASLIVTWGANGLTRGRIEGLGRDLQRIDPRCLEGARSRPGTDDVDGCGGAACHNSMVGGEADQAARSLESGQRS